MSLPNIARVHEQRKKSGSVYFLYTQNDNPLISIRAESMEGAGQLSTIVKLTAAAPDMLAALQGILPYVMPERLSWQPGPEYTHYHASKAVRAAITRATKG